MTHVDMSFRFASMHDAYTAENKLKELAVPAVAVFERGYWTVKTDTRCLAHAPALTKFLYKAQAKGGAR